MPYLAMTAAEFHSCRHLPQKPAWMACHFSPYGTGLTNFPSSLPPCSILILNDRTPVHGHDPIRICDQLAKTCDALNCAAVLLDLQRNCEEGYRIVAELLKLPCPVIVSEQYAGNFDCPVFLPPVPLLKTAEEHVAPWAGREIWLEAALDGIEVTLTEAGSTVTALPYHIKPNCGFEDEDLCCHYRIAASGKEAVFTIQRTKGDLDKLLDNAKKLGVNNFVGLYQELGM